MKKNVRAKITVEKERLLVISNPRMMAGKCELCQGEVTMLDIAQAARITNASQREIFRVIESGALHFAETQEGSLLICFESLRQNFFRA